MQSGRMLSGILFLFGGICGILGRKCVKERSGKQMTKRSSRNQGILFILLSALSFACMSACVRLAGEVPTIQKSFFRNIVSLAVASFVLIREKKGFRPDNPKNWPLLLARAFFGTAGLLANFYALDHLLLADANMLNKMSPFFAVLASYFILKEKLNWVHAVSLAGAFLGVLFIVKPSFHNMLLGPSLVGLLGGLCAGVAYTLVRKLGTRGERSSIIVFVFSAFSCLTALPFLIADFCPMTWKQTLFLLGAGVFASCGQFSITAAYTHAPAREISVYDYSQIIFSTLLGFCIFGDRPDLLSILGYIIICLMAAINYSGNRKQCLR